MKKIYSLLLIALLSTTFTSNAQVVISQVYGGGGNSGATYTHDFIELFNRGTVAQDLTGWSVQYASATSATPTWAVQPLTAFTLQPGKYYLIQCAAGATTSGALPTPDSTVASGALTLSGTAGKVVLANSITAVTTANPTDTQKVDLVAYGNTATTGFEGTGPTGTQLSNTTSASRLNGGCTDTNNNSTDFAAPAAPNPRNSSTATYSCTAPSISIASPVNNTIFSPETTSVSITPSVNNFVVANGSGDGHIQYTVNGGTAVMKYDTTSIVIPTTPGTYTIAMQLYNNANAPLSPAATSTVTFTVASYTTVTDLAALRADVVANGANKYYQLGSSPVISYARTTRNQKYIQDATGGILIDDNGAVITTTFASGDSMVGLKGQATLFSSLLQFIPTVNPTLGTSGNVVTPQVVTIADLNTAVTAATYESELVQINNVTFDLTVANFPATALNMNITNGPDTLVFRSIFTEANYMSQPKPTAATNIIVLVGRAGTVAQVASRNLTDLNAPLSSNQFNEIAGFSMYPNPVSNGKLFFTSENNIEKTVAIYDLVGKQIINQVVTNELNVASLTTGVYVVKVTEEGKTATRKLIVR